MRSPYQPSPQLTYILLLGHTHTRLSWHTHTLRWALNTRNYSWQKRHKQLIRPAVNKPATDQPTRLHLLLSFLNMPSKTSIHRDIEHSEIVSLSTSRTEVYAIKLLAATIKALNDKNSLLKKGRKESVCVCVWLCTVCINECVRVAWNHHHVLPPLFFWGVISVVEAPAERVDGGRCRIRLRHHHQVCSSAIKERHIQALIRTAAFIAGRTGLLTGMDAIPPPHHLQLSEEERGSSVQQEVQQQTRAVLGVNVLQ